jgi:hypothetical protein
LVTLERLPIRAGAANVVGPDVAGAGVVVVVLWLGVIADAAADGVDLSLLIRM